MNTHKKLNYVEFPAKNIAATKQCFSAVFNWEFVDYGAEYTAIFDTEPNGNEFAVWSETS